MHTYIHTYTQTHMDAYTCTHMHAHTHIHTCMRTYMHAHTHTRTHTCIHANSHTHTYTHMHTSHTDTHIDAHNFFWIHKFLTWDFWSSSQLTAFMIAVLNCWHIQHKSVQGLAVTMWDKSFSQYPQWECFVFHHLLVGHYWSLLIATPYQMA